MEHTQVPRYLIEGHQYINGAWRTGRSAKRLDDNNPYTGEKLLEMPLASIGDLDDAYQSARAAQDAWGENISWATPRVAGEPGPCNGGASRRNCRVADPGVGQYSAQGRV